MNAAELVEGLSALPGAQDAGAGGNGIVASRLLNGVEYARSAAVEEPKLRASYKRRHGGGATPLVLLADDPEQTGFVRVLGPQRDGPLRRVRADSFFSVVERTLVVRRLQAVRLLAEELDRLDTERVAGLKVSGLGTEHLYGERLPNSSRWAALTELSEGASRSGWRELLSDLGYTFEPLQPQGYLASADGHPAFVVYPRALVRTSSTTSTPTRDTTPRSCSWSATSRAGIRWRGRLASRTAKVDLAEVPPGPQLRCVRLREGHRPRPH